MGTPRLAAVRVGEFDPPMFARAAKSLQQAMDGRLTINIISSDRAGRVDVVRRAVPPHR